MKKQYKFLSGILALVASISIVGAQNLGNLMDTLGTDTSFGYSNDKKVTVKNIANGIVTLESPIIKDGSGNTITSYTVMYSQYPLTEILEKTDLLNQAKEATIIYTGTTNPFTMDIGIVNPDTTKKYYLFVLPNNAKSTFGQISNEVWANLADGTSGDAGDTTTSAAHNAATSVDMSLAHISHISNGNTINLLWTAIEGSKTIDIDVMKPGTNEYVKAANVNMSAEKYSFTADKNGEYVFRFLAVDCGAQTTYTVTMSDIKATPAAEPTPAKGVITKVPKTGPAESFLVVLLIAILGYFGYNKLYRKTK